MKYIVLAIVLLVIFVSCSPLDNTMESRLIPLMVKDTGDNSGVYIPAIYIAALAKTKSHLKASSALSIAGERIPNAIILKDKMLKSIWNFHESTQEEIVLLGEAKFESKDKRRSGTISIQNGIIILPGNAKYLRIDKDTSSGKLSVGRFIVKYIIGKVNLNNGLSTLSTNDQGQLLYNGTTYEYGVGLVFTSINSDYIYSEKNSLDIHISDSMISLFRVDIPEKLKTDPFGLQSAKDIEIESFSLKAFGKQ